MALYSGAPYQYTSTASGLVFTAGACPLDAEGRVVGAGDHEMQARVCLQNLIDALGLEGAGPEQLLKTTIYVVAMERSDLLRVWNVVAGRIGRVPSTLLGVTLLGYPEQLVEIDAIAEKR
jgi:enamine deaminase RidA (YjgF/YER057c/UK114 family)